MTVNTKENVFTLKKKDVLPYEKDDSVQISVTVEMDLSLMQYSRSIYTFFDLLSDVGGLSGMFFSIFALIVAIWTYNKFDNFMAFRLFKIRKPQNELEELRRKPNGSRLRMRRSTFLKLSSVPEIKALVTACIPKRLICCKASRNERALERAREKLEKEANIVENIKARRYFR